MSDKFGPYTSQVIAFVEAIDGERANGYGDHLLERDAEGVWYDTARIIRRNYSDEYDAAHAYLEDSGVCSILAERAIGALIAQDHLGVWDVELLVERPFGISLRDLCATKKAVAA